MNETRGRRGTILCPACGAVALRKESRKTLSPKAPKVQLFVCEGTPKRHFTEAILYLMHTDEVGQPKKYLNRYSTKGAKAAAVAAQEDFDE